MIVIGLDISMRATGVAVADEGYGLLSSALIETRKVHPNTEIDCVIRASQQAKKICSIIEKWKPDLCVIEAPAYNALIPVKGKFGLAMKLASSVCQLWQLTGAIKGEIIRCWPGLRIEVISPTAVKKHIAGNGKASKEDMIASVHRDYGYLFTDHNLCDAYSLCVCYFDGVAAKDMRQGGRK